MSASLLTTMTQADVNTTLEVLSEHDVDARELKFFRTYRRGFAGSVASAIKRGFALYVDAVRGSEGEALTAVRQIEDPQILGEIYKQSTHPSVWVAVMEMLTDENQIFHLILVHSHPGREVASLVGLWKLPRYLLNEFQADDGCIASDVLAWRRKLILLLDRKNVSLDLNDADLQRG